MVYSMSASSDVSELAAFAFQSSNALSQAVTGLPPDHPPVRDLKAELKDLNKVLKKLQKSAINKDDELTMLRYPLFQCGNSCKDIEAVIVKFIWQSRGPRKNIQDWVKIRYMGDDISAFKNQLASYKSTFTVALGTLNLRASTGSQEFNEALKHMITSTTVELKKRLQEIDDKIHALRSEGLAEQQSVREARDSAQQCISVCVQIDTQVHRVWDRIPESVSTATGDHLVNTTTSENLISIKNVTSGTGSTTFFGPMSDDSMEKLTEDVSRYGAFGDCSRASSVISLTDSVFSITSGSSKSSVGPAGAGEMLVELLLGDNHLSLLFQEALTLITADKFERNFRRILKGFSIELRKEAKNSQQRSVAHLVCYQARNCAHLIRNAICSQQRIQEDVTPKFELHEPANIDSDESDDDLGPAYEDDTDMQQSEEFIITSQAFIKLRYDLILFIYPTKEGKCDGKPTGVNKTDAKEELEKHALCEQDSSTSLEKCPDLHTADSSQNMNPPVLNNYNMVYEKSSCWHKTRFMILLRVFWEPKVQEGKTRVRWKCKCGQNLYDDYIELQNDAAKHLERSLNQHSNISAGHSQMYVTTVVSLIWSIFARVHHAFSREEQGLPIQHLPPIASGQQLATPSSPPAEALFLLICHNLSIYDKKLLQLPVYDHKSDASFFRALKNQYRAKYNKWLSFVSLRTLTGIKFVKFEMYRKSLSVDVRLKNDLPPPEHPDYCYAPVPVELIPPVGENRLMHLLNNPDCAEDVPACLDRFPKKLREKLACGDRAIVPGWGLDLEEGVCQRKTAIAYLTCVLASSIWGILWSVTGHDIGGAFTVSAYIIGIMVPLMTLMQHLA